MQYRIVLTIAFVVHVWIAMRCSAAVVVSGRRPRGIPLWEGYALASMFALMLTAIGAALVRASHSRPWAWRQLEVLMLLWSVVGVVGWSGGLAQELSPDPVMQRGQWKILFAGSLPFPLQVVLAHSTHRFRRRLGRDDLSETFE